VSPDTIAALTETARWAVGGLIALACFLAVCAVVAWMVGDLRAALVAAADHQRPPEYPTVIACAACGAFRQVEQLEWADGFQAFADPQCRHAWICRGGCVSRHEAAS
jgi:hypothetical protein